LHLMQDSVTT